MIKTCYEHAQNHSLIILKTTGPMCLANITYMLDLTKVALSRRLCPSFLEKSTNFVTVAQIVNNNTSSARCSVSKNMCEHALNILWTRLKHAKHAEHAWTCTDFFYHFYTNLQSFSCLACSATLNMLWTRLKHAKHAEHAWTWPNMNAFFEHEKKIFEHALCLKC